MAPGASMALTPGTRLGPYEVVAPLGAGGMGEVYRARDTRPQVAREVAIKLVSSLASDTAAVARFEREARITAGLAHPNVVALFDVGVHDGTPYLVEELLAGETLRERLRGGPVPPRKAVEWLRQVTLGLAAAHARELVHRDVKPENIFLTSDGHVKLLDFGLAKAATGPAPSAITAAQAATSAGDAVTSGQVVLGTVSYMSPEQVRGQALDHRSDIFSVGVVLYELLTGRRPFDRATPADTMSAILTTEPPPLSQAGVLVPPGLERLTARCLEKAPADRFQSTRDLAFALETAVNDTGAASGAHAPGRAPRRGPLALRVAIGVAGLALAFATGRATTSQTSSPRVTTRLQLAVDGDLFATGGVGIALSHDSRTLALTITGPDGVRRIHTRRLDEDVTRAVPDTNGGASPFFSPDDRALGFMVGNEVRQTTLGGGRPSLVWRSLETNTLNVGRADWYGPRAFVIAAGTRALMAIGEAGDPPQGLRALGGGEFGHLFPQVLRGGPQVLYVSYPLSDAPGDASVMVQPIGGGEPRVVVRGSTYGRVFGKYLLYENSGSIMASRFDEATVQPVGSAVSVLTMAEPLAGFQVAFGNDQTLAYHQSGRPPARQLQWVDAKSEAPLAIPPLNSLDFAVSPDYSAVVATVGQLSHYLVVGDVKAGTTTRLTTNVHAHSPLFTPDGNSVVFNVNGALHIIDIRAGSEPRPLGEGKGARVPYAWMPDGKTLVFTEVSQETGADIWAMDPNSKEAPTLLVRTAGHDRYPAVSPDGAWLAFTSEENGRAEVFVQPLNRVGQRRRITLEGGVSPLWAPDGRRLYWRTGNDIISVDVDATGAAQGRPVIRATGPFVANAPYTSYAVGRDGRLLVGRNQPQRPVRTVEIVLNWDVEIERLISEAEAKR